MFAKLQLGLKAKTSAAGTTHPPTVAQYTQRVSRDSFPQLEPPASLKQDKSKIMMSAMRIPKFNGKVRDYPEWKNLFKDCVEVKHEKCAVIMILRT